MPGHDKAEATIGDEVFRLKEDESTYVPVNTTPRLANPGTEPLEIIEVQSGDYQGEGGSSGSRTTTGGWSRRITSPIPM